NCLLDSPTKLFVSLSQVQLGHTEYPSLFYGSLLQFSPRNAPPGSLPVVLWNRTDPETSELGRGGLGSDGRVWVAERVTQTDQGNYTILDDNGKVISRSQLTVNGELQKLHGHLDGLKGETQSFRNFTDIWMG
uniref:Uncharacterized protein n=1 Tax=Esox lucius TaxID=8010 RepID=A0AAY5KPR1_ESOLU